MGHFGVTVLNESLTNAMRTLGIPQSPSAIAIGDTWKAGTGDPLVVTSPIDGSDLMTMSMASSEQIAEVTGAAQAAFRHWRVVPAPVRGEFVRRIGEQLRRFKSELATLVTWEAGKIVQESLGEVQEMIDICDFSVGLSRQLYGKTIASERPFHRLTEQWHPLGPVGVITAFNFPVAVWAWNAMIALVCGDPVVWKPSEKTPITAIACHTLAQSVVTELEEIPDGLLSLVIGDAVAGQRLAESTELPLISATGSVPMGRTVAQSVAARLGKSLLELGGNNGMIVTPSADMELALRSTVFAAVGTCGQRCTTLRRLIVHESVADDLRDRLWAVFQRLPIGDPNDSHILMGPLVDQPALEAMRLALESATEQGGRVHGGEVIQEGVPSGGAYVRPALVEIDAEAPIVQQETFAPILYLIRYEEFDEAIELHNAVPQGLASAIVTRDVQEAERFCSAVGSDCGIVNVNIGTSGAEIGGAFGGEKETGGGRESGSDAWKAYMRRTTNTVNYADELPLAQGIRFEIE